MQVLSGPLEADAGGSARVREGRPEEAGVLITTSPQLRQRIDQLADDIGRLHRHAQQLTYLADRLAEHAETLHQLTTPPASQLAKQTAPGDPEAADAAIQAVDQDHAQFQTRLGKTTA